MRINNFIVAVRPLSVEEGGGFLAEAPDLPGCMADGETAQEALQDWIKTGKKFDDINGLIAE